MLKNRACKIFLYAIFGFASNAVFLPQYALAVNCSPIRYSYTTWSPLITTSSTTNFGGVPSSYDNLQPPSWLESESLYSYQTYVDTPATATTPATVGTKRLAGYAAVSSDCGQTWVAQPDYVPPLGILGPAGINANGVDHFASRTDTNWDSQGFVTNFRWDLSVPNNRIYPVFNYNSKWSYYSLVNGQPVNPVIGNLNPSIPDNFYSPTIVPTGDAAGTIQLYFGGWRGISSGTLPQCQGPLSTSYGTGPTEKDCTCSLTSSGFAYDACTGDKIFMATNQMSVGANGDYLAYQVYRPSDGTYTATGWDSANFEPVIYSALINNGCYLNDQTHCPFPLVHTNDPTVVKPVSLGGRQVMYFTGGIAVPAPPPGNQNLSQNYTYSAVSDDGGKTWKNFAILTKDNGVRFPGGFPFNEANGTVRAFSGPDALTGQDRIFLLSMPDNSNPLFNNTNNDNAQLFEYEINPAYPDIVLSAKKLNYTSLDLARCTKGIASTCISTAQIFTPTIPETPPTSLPLYKQATVPTANLFGQTGEDYVGTTSFTPDGVPDVHIRLTGISKTIKSVSIWGTNGASEGIWAFPFNGAWVVGVYPQSDPSIVDLYFDYYINFSSYNLKITYTDNSISTLTTPNIGHSVPVVPIPPPPPPTGLNAIGGIAQVVLNWNVSAGAASYSVARYNGSQWAWLAIHFPQTTYTDTAVTNGTMYTYALMATNASGNSGVSLEVNATPTPPPPPAAPTGFEAIGGLGHVVLDWAGSAGATSYAVARYNGSQWTWITTSWPQTAYTDTTVTNGITYYYIVVAINANAISPSSSLVNATPT